MEIIQRIDKLEPKFNELSSSHNAVKFTQECLFAKQLLENNSFMMSMAQDNPQSLENAVLNIATIGLSLNPALKYAYLVPRDRKICLDISYMGLIHLAIDSGGIEWVQSVIVRDKDDFIVNGIGEKPTHKFNAFKDRGDIVGCYCVAKTINGDFLTHILSIEAVNDIRDRSQAYKGFLSKGTKCPWVTDYEEMVKKTVVKQASKFWPKTGERFKTAVEAENDSNGIDFQEEKEEVKQARIEQSQKEKEDYLEEVRLKELKVDRIKISLGTMSEGMTIEQKGKMLVEFCDVRAFGDLSKKPIAHLDQVIDKINKFQAKPKEIVIEKPTESTSKRPVHKTAKDVTFKLR